MKIAALLPPICSSIRNTFLPARKQSKEREGRWNIYLMLPSLCFQSCLQPYPTPIQYRIEVCRSCKASCLQAFPLEWSCSRSTASGCRSSPLCDIPMSWCFPHSTSGITSFGNSACKFARFDLSQ